MRTSISIASWEKGFSLFSKGDIEQWASLSLHLIFGMTFILGKEIWLNEWCRILVYTIFELELQFAANLEETRSFVQVKEEFPMETSPPELVCRTK